MQAEGPQGSGSREGQAPARRARSRSPALLPGACTVPSACRSLADEQNYLLRDAEAEVLFSFSLEESLRRAHLAPLFKVPRCSR